MKRNYRIEWNDNFYAIIDVENDELVMNGNTWDNMPDPFDPLEYHRAALERYEATRRTVWDEHNDGLREGFDVLGENGMLIRWIDHPALNDRDKAEIKRFGYDWQRVTLRPRSATQEPSTPRF